MSAFDEMVVADYNERGPRPGTEFPAAPEQAPAQVPPHPAAGDRTQEPK